MGGEPVVARGVAALAIGDELLSGKVRDQNLHYLAGELRALGVPLRLAMVVADDVAEIGEALAFARARADVVLTTGGVGPTHDDITLAAIAAAFGVDLVRDPTIAAAIHAYYGPGANDDVLGMADVPRGAELIQPAPFFLPIFRLENVFVFPGDPGALRVLFDPWKEALRQPPYRVLVTLEGKEEATVLSAARALVRRLIDHLGPEAVLRTSPPVEAAREAGATPGPVAPPGSGPAPEPS